MVEVQYWLTVQSTLQILETNSISKVALYKNGDGILFQEDKLGISNTFSVIRVVIIFFIFINVITINSKLASATLPLSRIHKLVSDDKLF